MADSQGFPGPIWRSRVAGRLSHAVRSQRDGAPGGARTASGRPGAERWTLAKAAQRGVSSAAQLYGFSDGSGEAGAGCLYAERRGFYARSMQTAQPRSARALRRTAWGRRCAGVALLLAALLGVSEARAGGYEETLREGVAARDRARASERSSDWQHAQELFARAAAEHDTPEARFELAEAASELDNVAIAYESYEISLDKGLSGKAAEIARAFMAAHEDEVARLELVGPTGSSVFVNGQRRAQLPLARPLVVPAGRVRLGLVAPRAAPWEEAVHFDAQVLMHLAPELALESASRPPPEAREQPGFLSQHPGAIALLSLAGVSFVAGGVFAYQYVDRDGEADDAREQIQSALQGHIGQGLIGVSASACTGVGIASGTVAFDPSIDSSAQQSIVADYANACAELKERTQAADRYRTLALVGFGVGAVASAALLTWYFADSAEGEPPQPDRARGPRLVPVLTADSGGLLVDLTF
jgi:hypothetical protein